MEKTNYYKYRSVNNLSFLLDILVYNRLYLASYSELNDPLEGAYRISNGVNYDNWLELFHTEKQAIRICSLSKTYNNMLMWSHYADSHKGCCIELELKSKKGIIEKPVEYVETIQELRGEDSLKEAIDILSRKLKCWLYEQEVRLLKEIPRDSRKSKFIKIKIVRIYLGCKMAAKDVRFYTNLIHSIDPKIEVKQLCRTDLTY